MPGRCLSARLLSCALVVLASCALGARGAAAQRAGLLALPLADANAPRESASMFSTDLFAPDNHGRLAYLFADSARDYHDPQVAVSVGETLRLLEVPVGRCRVALGGEGAVFARFRLNTHSKENLSDDWWVAAPVAAGCSRVTLRLRYRHQSAHLGDDAVTEMNPGIYDWSHEFVDALASVTPVREVRVYAGGGRAVHTHVPGEHYEWTYGLDVRLRAGRAGALVAGAERDGSDRLYARGRFSGALGFESAYPLHAPMRLLLRRLSGESTAGQFDGSVEHFWAVEVGFLP